MSRMILLAAAAVCLIATRVGRAEIIHVPGDHPTIQAAIDAALDGDEVVVADGTWTGPDNRSLDTGGRSLTVRSAGGASVCTIDCEELGRAFSIHSGETVRLVGLRIVHGLEELEDGDGGALRVESSTVIVEDCVFSDNRVNGNGDGGIAENGGAVALIDTTAVFVRCAFLGNKLSPSPENGLGGAISCDGGSVMLTDCTLSGNRAYGDCTTGAGGGLGLRDAEAILLRCDITGNTAQGGSCGGVGVGLGGGVSCSGAAGRVTAIGCTFRNNVARGTGEYGATEGGGVWVDEQAIAILVNCAFADNTAEAWYVSSARGGAFAGAAALINCTITENTCSDSYGEAPSGGVLAHGACTVTNSIVWGNGPDAIVGPAVVEYSDVEGGWPGMGNIDADPMFVDGAEGDFRLRSGSPSIDAADNGALPADTYDLDADGDTDESIPFDLDGNPRFVDDPDTEDTGLGDPPIVDMGAYEFRVACHADLNSDGNVGSDDLANLLDSWGACPGCPADLDGSGDVGFDDLLIVLGDWGPCPG